MVPSFLVTILAAGTAIAADELYTIWSSVIFNRIGDSTPDVINDAPTVLTSLGAQQSFSSGSFFRDRYLLPDGAAPIYGMSSDTIDLDQFYVQTLDEQVTIASAMAFVQGLYPPTTLNSSFAALLDPSSISSNGSYIVAPLNGYQYPQLHVSGALDPDYIYLGANLDCPAYNNAVSATLNNPAFKAMQASSKDTYLKMAPLMPNLLTSDALDFANAYAIYNYISYQAAHDQNTFELLQTPQYIDPSTNQSYLYTLRWLADAQQQFDLANLTAYSNATKSTTLPAETTGSISTIAGNYLAAKILDLLSTSINSGGQVSKLSVMFGDFDPMISLFALMSLPNTSSNFTGLPEYASSAVFELYSWENTTNVTFPSTDNLYVSFHFRNGSDETSEFYSYPAFLRGPDQTDMSWEDFVNLMTNILLGDIGDWCLQCGAQNLFCAAWNPALTYTTTGTSTIPASGSSSSGKPDVSPVVAGVIGAVVTLVLATVFFVLVMIFGRIRFHRAEKKKTSDLGGFKGSNKLASDRDLTLPTKGGTVISTADNHDFAAPVDGGHERTGSWELRQNHNADAERDIMEHALPRKQSFEDMDEDDLRISPFAEPVHVREGV